VKVSVSVSYYIENLTLCQDCSFPWASHYFGPLGPCWCTGSGLGVAVIWTMAGPLICVEVIRSGRYIKRGLGTTSYVVATPAVDYTNYETDTSDKSAYAPVIPQRGVHTRHGPAE